MNFLKNNLVQIICTAVGVFLGVLVAGLVYWNVTTLVSTTKKTNDVINFINANIQASQKAQQ